ncbi:MAG: hypothetical protein Kilf2KO_46920 [Rhodospirillales bacterium]
MAEERPLIGGCDFPVDPDIAAPGAPVFWRPEIAPAVVTLVAALPDLGLRSLSFSDNMADLRTDDRGLSWVRLHNGAVLVGAEEPWKTSSLKAQVARLAAHGRFLIDTGYKALLRGRR